MCFVYHENDHRWVTWGLQSELNLIQPDGHYTGVNCDVTTTPAPTTPAPTPPAPPATTPTTAVGLSSGCGNLVTACGSSFDQDCTIAVSSMLAGSIESWVHDGKTNPAAECVDTPISDDPWLRVDLGRLARIDAVKVYGSSGKPMSNFDIRVSNSASYTSTAPACATGLSTDTSGYSVDVVCSSGLLGRYVFIAVPGTGKELSVCELVVSGDSPLNNYQWLVTGQPSFSMTFADYAQNVLLKLDAACNEGDSSQVCGYKSDIKITASAMQSGVWGEDVISHTTLESALCLPGAPSCVMQFKIIANDVDFTVTWMSEGTEGSLSFPHQIETGIRNFKVAFTEAVDVDNNPTVPTLTVESALGGAGDCAPTQVSTALPKGTKITGGGTIVDGTFMLAVGSHTKVSFPDGIAGDYTYSSVVKFGSASSTSRYAFWAQCGMNYILFSDPPKLVGCEFGDVTLASFSAVYDSNFRFTAGRRNGKLSILVNGMVMLREYAMAWTVWGMGWGYSDTTITIVSMASECNDPNIFIALPPSSSCLVSDFICDGNLSSAVSVVDERSAPQGGAHICGASYRIGGFTSWTANNYQMAAAGNVGVKATFSTPVAIGEDFAIESVVLFEEGLSPYVPWGVAFQFYAGNAAKEPYRGQQLFGFEWNYTWSNGGTIGSSTDSDTSNRYERYESAPGIYLNTNTWYKFTFLRTGDELTVLLDGQWVLMQTVAYPTSTVNGVGWRSGRTTMRVRELKRVAGAIRPLPCSGRLP